MQMGQKFCFYDVLGGLSFFLPFLLSFVPSLLHFFFPFFLRHTHTESRHIDVIKKGSIFLRLVRETHTVNCVVSFPSISVQRLE